MNDQSANVALLEPFFSGSHKSFALGWQGCSGHRINVHGLPGRFWKWRMRGAAFEFARMMREMKVQPEVVFANSMLDLAHFRALLGRNCPPLILYFHECQAAYPLKEGQPMAERDYQFLITDLASAGAADRVYFNSAWLKEAFFSRTGEFLRRMPDYNSLWLLEDVEKKSAVLGLGLSLSDLKAPRREWTGPVRVLWPHRWEHDKNPEEFFRALFLLHEEGVPFRLNVAGASFSRVPAIFGEARARLADRIDHWGEVKGREAYGSLLSSSDLAVSTASHETFGIAMAEAAYAGAHPLAPRRLSYPEVFPAELHGECLYDDFDELVKALRSLMLKHKPLLEHEVLREKFSRHAWENRVAAFDHACNEVLQFANLC